MTHTHKKKKQKKKNSMGDVVSIIRLRAYSSATHETGSNPEPANQQNTV